MQARRNILIPTDFAPCAQNAMRYAVLWGQSTPSYLHFYHRIGGMPVGWSALPPEEQARYPKIIETIASIHEQFEPWKRQLESAGIPHRLIYSGGSIMENIVDYMSFEQIDFVFIGLFGKPQSRYDKLGSNAEKIVNAIEQPVLIAKDVYRDSINHVIFASAFDPRAMQSFKHFVELIAPLQPEIHLLNVDTHSFYRLPKALIIPAMQEFKQVASDFKCQLHFHEDSRVERGILQFSQDIDADLIALAQHSDRLFHSQRLTKAVRRLIRSAGLPVMLVDQSPVEDV